MKKFNHVNIIGAGLAGCEAAYQLAKKGIKVKLYEVKGVQKNPVQKLDGFAELVCSNSLRSNELSNAVGTLKEEMRILDSLIIKIAQEASVPAGGSLAVDREIFSKLITNEITNNKFIEIINEEVTELDPNQVTLVCTGPLTTEKFQNTLYKWLGSDDFYFYDAVAPIITKDSIDFNIAYFKNRYDKGDTKDYINCPMTKEEYDSFYKEIIAAEVAISHLAGEKELKYFEGCMPVEALAKRGEKTLLFGAMKPKGLDRNKDLKNHAVVQLRQDDANDQLYNIVGFQTNLKWGEQNRIFRMIPGLEKANFIRYGVMHKNNFINSPKLLNEYLQLKTNSNIFFAGQITGVEGYVESCVTGLIAALNIVDYVQGVKFTRLNAKCVTGALIAYINNASKTNFQPMKANWGIVLESDLQMVNDKVRRTKQDKQKLKTLYKSEIAIKEINKYLEAYNNKYRS